MSIITKESIADTIEGLEQLVNRGIQSVHIDMAIAGMHRLLASLEAEPAIHRWRRVTVEPYGPYPWHYGNFIGFSKPVEGIEDEYFYSAPPAPVSMPDFGALTKCIVQRLVDYGSADDDAIASAEEFVYNACRAAMLQGADTELQRKAAIHDSLCKKHNVESLADFVDWQRNHIAELEAAPPAPVGPGEAAVMPEYPGYVMTQRECFQAGKKDGLAEAGNSPAIPDGWVACSERMPDPKSKFRVCAYTPTPREDIRFRFVPASLFKSVCRDATHWQYMLPPAAPQQEAK